MSRVFCSFHDFFSPQVVNRADVGMIESGGRASFSLKSRQGLRVAGYIRQ